MPETIKAYLETVQEQIRWRRARPVLVRELERHLEDQRDDFIKEGRPEDEAERLAVQDMGDPVAVGAELDAVHRPKPQWGLLGMTIALALVGSILRMIFLNQGSPFSLGWSPELTKNLASLGLGTAAMLGMYFLDVSRLSRYAKAVYLTALVLSAGSFWHSVNQAPYISLSSYWLSYFFAQFLPVVYALWVYAWRRKRWIGFFLAIAGGIPLAAASVTYPSMTNLLLFLFSGFVVTLLAVWQDWFAIGRRKGICAVLGIAFASLAYLLSQGYFDSFLSRVSVALHPELDQHGRGYMGWMLKMFWEDVPPLRRGSGEASLAVSAGMRIFGGGAEMQPVGFSKDFLPASIAVSWGWLPLFLLLAALTALLVWMLVKGLRQKYLLGRFVVLAVVMTLAVQVLFSTSLNLGVVLFAASLPLVVGNFQTVISMALIGLALSVFRGEAIGWDEPVIPLRRMRRIRLRIEVE